MRGSRWWSGRRWAETTARLTEAAGEPVPSIAGIAAAPAAPNRPPPLGSRGRWCAGLGEAEPVRLDPVRHHQRGAGRVLVAYEAWRFIDWAVIHAVWSGAGRPRRARPTRRHASAVQGTGACWALVADEVPADPVRALSRIDEQWRPALVVALFIGLYAVSRRCGRSGAPGWLLVWVGRADADRRADVGRRSPACRSCRRRTGAGCRSR